MFQEIQVGDLVDVDGISSQVERVSSSRFWVNIQGESVKFNKKTGIEYGGARRAICSQASNELVLRESIFAPSTIELLANILQTPNSLILASTILTTFGSLTAIRRASANELAAVPGMTMTLANRIRSAIDFARHLFSAQDEDKPRVASPDNAATLLMPEMRDLQQEHVRLILLDTRNNVLAIPTLTIGSVNSAIIRLADAFRLAMQHGAVAMILAHNHPSGDPSPSPEDVSVTRKFVEAGDLIDIKVLDHIVVGNDRYVSLRERGLGF